MKKEQEILLRPLTMDDDLELFKLTSDEKAAKFMRFDAHKDIAQTKLLISEYLSPRHLGYAIIRKEDNSFVGYIALTESDEELSCYSMSTMISPEFWNCGYSTCVVQKIIELAQSSDQIKALIAYIVSENFGSCRVMEKCGFIKIDELHFEDLVGSLYIYRHDIKQNE